MTEKGDKKEILFLQQWKEHNIEWMNEWIRSFVLAIFENFFVTS